MWRIALRPAVIPRVAFLTVLAVGADASAQGFAGRWEVRNQQGGITSLTLVDSGGARLTGAFSGNGNAFTVRGTATSDQATGTISGRGMSLFFEAHLQGNTLLLVLAEPAANGQPNLATAQQVVMTRTTTLAEQAGVIAPSAPIGATATIPSATGATGAPSATGVTPARAGPGGVTTQDRQVIALLVATPWCAFSYSGAQSATGSSGTTRTERVVLSADGTARSNRQGEFSGSGVNGSATVGSADGQTGRWRFARGILAFSTDGVEWQPVEFTMTYNSNGYPIPVVGGREYMACR